MNFRSLHRKIVFILPIMFLLLLTFRCDDKPIFGTSRNIDVPGKSISIQLNRDFHKSGYSTLNIFIQGLVEHDYLSAILVGKQPMDIWSVEEQKAFPQDTVFLDLYAERTASTYQAQIRYQTKVDSAAFLVMLNSEIVVNENINISQGTLLKELYPAKTLLKPNTRLDPASF